METFTYTAGDEHPGLTLPWQTETAQGVFSDLNLSSGYTFAVSLVDSAGTASVKSAVVTGANGSVNIAWAIGDLPTAGVFNLKLIATEVATNKQRSYSPNRPVKIQVV